MYSMHGGKLVGDEIHKEYIFLHCIYIFFSNGPMYVCSSNGPEVLVLTHKNVPAGTANPARLAPNKHHHLLSSLSKA